MDEKILKRISRRWTLDKDLIDELVAYDAMVNMEWSLPPELEAKDWAVKFISPAAHDAEKTATNVFDTYKPKWDVLPFGPENKDQAEEYETFLEWHMQQANTHGETEPFREIMKYAVRHNGCAAQLDYLPYWLPKNKDEWTDEQKTAAPFCIYVHTRSNIRYEMGKYGLRWISPTINIPAADVIDHWEAYKNDPKNGKKITSAIAKVEKLLDDDEEARVNYVDYTANDRRYVACWLSSDNFFSMDIFDEDGKADDVIVIYDAPNKLGFINWVVAVGSSDPLLAPLHKGDLWLNANLNESIKRSNAYRRAFYPLLMEEGQGEDVEIDYSGDVDKIKVSAGKKITQLVPPPLEPAFNELSAQDNAIIAQATSVQSMTAGQPASNVQFATVQAFWQISLTNLAPYKRTAEKIMVGLGNLVFKWLMVSDGTITAYRVTGKGKNRKSGAKINISKESFDMEHLYISAELLANTPTDKSQLVNQVQQMKAAGLRIPDREHVERLGYGNPEALAEEFEQEQMENTALGLLIERLRGMLQMELAQAQGQLQMAQQAQQGPQPQGSPTPPIIPEGQGYNTGQGGASPATAAPEQTQTQIPI